MQVLKPEVRERIMKAGTAEFSRGYASASMRSIARVADMTPGNIYRYFKGKEDLFNAVITELRKKHNTYKVAKMRASRALVMMGDSKVLDSFTEEQLSRIARGQAPGE